MNIETQTVPTHDVFKRAGVKETTVLLVVAWLIPFVVHLLPWNGERPLGAHLLPMFWVAFVAVYLHGLRVGLLVGLFAPVLNLMLTGLPALRWMSVLGFELIVFAVLAWWIVRRAPLFWLIAPMGYLAAKTASSLLQYVATPSGEIGTPLVFFLESLRSGLPGLGILTAINLVLVLLYPKSRDEKHNDSAGV